MDRLYTSLELFDWLLEKKITAVGTIMLNRAGIPPAIKIIATREEKSYTVLWDAETGKKTFHSYVVNTKSKGKKNVLILSTMPPLLGTTKDEKRKPATHKFYDFTKGGTDIVDQRIGCYSVNCKSNRWSMTAFCYILDTARVNSQCVHSLQNGKQPRESNSFQYCADLVNELVSPHIIRRAQQSDTLNTNICNKMRLVLGDKYPSREITVVEPTPEKRKRCQECLLRLSPKAKRKLPPLKTKCSSCNNSVCKPHSYVLCQTCKDK